MSRYFGSWKRVSFEGVKEYVEAINFVQAKATFDKPTVMKIDPVDEKTFTITTLVEGEEPVEEKVVDGLTVTIDVPEYGKTEMRWEMKDDVLTTWSNYLTLGKTCICKRYIENDELVVEMIGGGTSCKARYVKF